MEMMEKDILSYLKHDDRLKALTFEQINLWIKNAPYSYVFHFIKAKKYTLEAKDIPDDVLHMVSTYSNDRRWMKEQLEMVMEDEIQLIEDAIRAIDVPVMNGKEEKDVPSIIKNQKPKTKKMSDEGIQVKGEESKELKIKAKKLKAKSQKPKTKKIKNILEEDLSSFTAWLRSMDTEPKEDKKLKDKSKKGKKKKKKPSRLEKMLQNSLHIKEGIVSETYADLLLQQGHVERASEMYKALMMKYPEKSNIFASKLEKIEKI